MTNSIEDSWISDIVAWALTGTTPDRATNDPRSEVRDNDEGFETNLDTLLGIRLAASEYVVRLTLNQLKIFLKLNPDGADIEEGFSRDVRKKWTF